MSIRLESGCSPVHVWSLQEIEELLMLTVLAGDWAAVYALVKCPTAETLPTSAVAVLLPPLLSALAGAGTGATKSDVTGREQHHDVHRPGGHLPLALSALLALPATEGLSAEAVAGAIKVAVSSSRCFDLMEKLTQLPAAQQLSTFDVHRALAHVLQCMQEEVGPSLAGSQPDTSIHADALEALLCLRPALSIPLAGVRELLRKAKAMGNKQAVELLCRSLPRAMFLHRTARVGKACCCAAYAVVGSRGVCWLGKQCLRVSVALKLPGCVRLLVKPFWRAVVGKHH